MTPNSEYSSEPLDPQFPRDLEKSGIPQEKWHRFSQHGLGTLIPKMGIFFEELTAEYTVATMPVAENTQPGGLLHGGASAALLETLGSFAANEAAPEGYVAVGTELNISHVRSATSGLVRGTCIALKIGRSQCVHRIDITDERGKLISTGRMTNSIIPRR